MASVSVQRVRRTDATGSYLLLHTTQTSKSKPLDLKLIATEHEHLYHGIIKQSSISSLQATNFDGDENQWRDLLNHALLPHVTSKTPKITQCVELVAAISGERCTVTVRRNIEGITQRLGSIKLDQDDEREEVSAFEWVDTAVASSHDLRIQLSTLQSSVASEQGRVAKLSKQLDDLVKAKKEHEELLLKKFAALLNAKKAKIRDQQRLLQRSTIEDGVAEAVGRTRVIDAREAVQSKREKRMAGAQPMEEKEDEMDVEEHVVEDDVDQDGSMTPEESTNEGSGDDAPELAFRERAGSDHDRNGLMSAVEAEIGQELPPRRELPFARGSTASGQTAKTTQGRTPVQYDEDTDDEL